MANLVNSLGKCATVRENVAGQKFTFVAGSSARPGFYLVKNDHGKCLNVTEDHKGAAIGVSDCNDTIPGQLWKWSHLN